MYVIRYLTIDRQGAWHIWFRARPYDPRSFDSTGHITCAPSLTDALAFCQGRDVQILPGL